MDPIQIHGKIENYESSALYINGSLVHGESKRNPYVNTGIPISISW